jgi:hypothetical protein
MVCSANVDDPQFWSGNVRDIAEAIYHASHRVEFRSCPVCNASAGPHSCTCVPWMPVPDRTVDLPRRKACFEMRFAGHFEGYIRSCYRCSTSSSLVTTPGVRKCLSVTSWPQDQLSGAATTIRLLVQDGVNAHTPAATPISMPPFDCRAVDDPLIKQSPADWANATSRVDPNTCLGHPLTEGCPLKVASGACTSREPSYKKATSSASQSLDLQPGCDQQAIRSQNTPSSYSQPKLYQPPCLNEEAFPSAKVSPDESCLLPAEGARPFHASNFFVAPSPQNQESEFTSPQKKLQEQQVSSSPFSSQDFMPLYEGDYFNFLDEGFSYKPLCPLSGDQGRLRHDTTGCTREYTTPTSLDVQGDKVLRASRDQEIALSRHSLDSCHQLREKVSDLQSSMSFQASVSSDATCAAGETAAASVWAGVYSNVFISQDTKSPQEGICQQAQCHKELCGHVSTPSSCLPVSSAPSQQKCSALQRAAKAVVIDARNLEERERKAHERRLRNRVAALRANKRRSESYKKLIRDVGVRRDVMSALRARQATLQIVNVRLRMDAGLSTIRQNQSQVSRAMSPSSILVHTGVCSHKPSANTETELGH